MIKDKYLFLIREILKKLENSKIDHFFLSKEEYDFFKNENIPIKKKEIKNEKKSFFKENIFNPSKLPLTYPVKEKKTFSFSKEKEKKVLKNLKNISKESKEFKSFIYLEKPQKNHLIFSDMEKLIKKLSPYSIIPTLDDTLAKNISKRWQLKKKCDVTIFSFQENPQEILFLKNLSFAIKTYFFPSQVISYSKLLKSQKLNIFFKENNIKLIIASDYYIWKYPYLTENYKEIPSSGEFFLKDIPLFLLPDISIYLKEPLLKKELWKLLCKKIKNL